MFIPLVDQLRCPRVHDETWLVASPSNVFENYRVWTLVTSP